MDIGDDLQLLLKMVKRNDLITEHEVDIVHFEIIQLVLGQPFIILQEIITEKSDGASGEPGQIRYGWTSIRPEKGFQDLHRLLLLVTGGFLAVLNFGNPVFGFHQQERIGSNKGVAGPLDSTFHTFQQERTLFVIKLLKHPDRRFRIGQ
ncbi:hypothetical protein D3C81_1834590 [compost metagenome]